MYSLNPPPTTLSEFSRPPGALARALKEDMEMYDDDDGGGGGGDDNNSDDDE